MSRLPAHSLRLGDGDAADPLAGHSVPRGVRPVVAPDLQAVAQRGPEADSEPTIDVRREAPWSALTEPLEGRRPGADGIEEPGPKRRLVVPALEEVAVRPG